MKTITAIEFVRPNGRQQPYQVKVSDEVYERFHALIDRGLRLTVEDLKTGLFNTCIELPGVDDFDMDICPKSMINKSFEKMICRFDGKRFEEFKKENDEMSSWDGDDTPSELDMFPDLGDK